MAGELEKQAETLVNDVQKALGGQSNDFRPLINDLQDMKSKDRAPGSTTDFSQMLALANQKLDAKFPTPFKDFDLTDIRSIEINGKQQMAAVLRNGKGNELALAENGMAISLVPDGKYTLNFDKGYGIINVPQADGRDHPVRITHPDGQISAYTYNINDRSGQPATTAEYAPNGQLISSYSRSGASTWNKTGGQGPDTIAGTVNVTASGNHELHMAGNTTLVRCADGSTYSVINGVESPHSPATPRQQANSGPFPMNGNGSKR